MYMYSVYVRSVGHPLRPLYKGFHTPSAKRCSTPLTMINFISHTEYQDLVYRG